MSTYTQRLHERSARQQRVLNSKRFAQQRIVSELRALYQIPKAVKLHLAGLSELKLAMHHRRHGRYDLARIQLAWSRRFMELSKEAGGFLP